MQRHLFDGNTRVSQKALDELPVARWMPPTIDKGGKLIQAEPRMESPLRQAVSQNSPKPEESAASQGDGETRLSAADSLQSYDEAREEGLLAGRQEGLKKGLEEGRQQGREQGLQQGVEEGRVNGHEQGYKAGLQKAETEIRQQLKTLNAMMTQVSHAINEQDYQLEQALLNLSQEIARHVVQRELMIDSSHIMSIVRQALETLPPSRDNVRILVNPADLALVKQAAEEGGENWRVIGNQHVARGGCRVETDQSAVDFTVGERFAQVIDHIVQRRFATDEDDADIPPGEVFEEAPEPVVRPIRLATAAAPKRSLADEAAELAADTVDVDPAASNPENGNDQP